LQLRIGVQTTQSMVVKEELWAEAAEAAVPQIITATQHHTIIQARVKVGALTTLRRETDLF